ncbi:hypothetical protein [Peribacillus sp. V2I11]|nr:hypothetical protein [Peribacillus sp. V2I11]MDQ0884765.1 hypothetical protein [Peribacillus sp. V2I11]
MKKVINMINPSSKVAGVSLLKLKKTTNKKKNGKGVTAPFPFCQQPL